MESTIIKLLHLPPLASAQGAPIDRLLFYVHVLMAVLFIGWSIFFGYVIWRFRVRKHPQADTAGARSHFSSYLEVAVAVAEAVLLLGFGVPIWVRRAAAGSFPPEKEATVIRIVGRQFNWMARYPGPDGIFGKADPRFVSASDPLGLDPADPNGKDDIVVESGEVVVPVGKPVIAHISSLDVIHSFAVRPLRLAQDAIPGLSSPIWFTPTVPGTYQINCAQLCGNGHAKMRGLLRVVTPEAYAAWLASKARPGAAGSYE